MANQKATAKSEPAKLTYGKTDNPYDGDDDILETTGYINGLVEFIKHCDTPMTIALQGDWGTGKTSFMNAIRKGLEPDNNADGKSTPDNNAGNGESTPDKIYTIFFNTWEYSRFQSSDDMYASFVMRIVSKLKTLNNLEDAADELLQGIAKAFTTAGIALLRYALENAGARRPILRLFADERGDKTAENMESGLEKVVDTLLKREEENAERIANLKNQFAAFIEKSAGPDGRVVIFVDDLDRLNPQTAVEFLEVLKLFLDVPHCVFVLAVDYDVVVSGLESKFKDILPPEKTRSFFDKIIQLPFQMPLGSYKIDKMFNGMFQKNTKPHTDAVLEFFKGTLGANPRTMKRLYNAYELQTLVYQKQNEEKNAKQKKKLDPYKSALLLVSLIVQLNSTAEYQTILGTEDAEDLQRHLGGTDDDGQSELREKILVALDGVAGNTKTNKPLTDTMRDFLGVTKELSSLTYVGGAAQTREAQIARIELPESLLPKESEPKLPENVSAAKAIILTFQQVLNRYLGQSPTADKIQDVRKFIEVNSTFLSLTERSDAQFVAKRELFLHGFNGPVYLATHNSTAGKQDYVARLCRHMNSQHNGKKRMEIAENTIFWVKADKTRLGCYPVSLQAPVSDTKKETPASNSAPDAPAPNAAQE